MSDDKRILTIRGERTDPEELDWTGVRKRPVAVEAVQMTDPFTVITMEGVMDGEAGHYLIRGVEGEYYPCDPDVFEQTYREAGDESCPVCGTDGQGDDVLANDQLWCPSDCPIVSFRAGGDRDA
jgi:hypothetical protein